MRNFIEVNTDKGKRLVNINAIVFIKEEMNGITEIVVPVAGYEGITMRIKAQETYAIIKVLIQEAL